MLSDLGTTARGHSQDRSSHHHSHTSDNIEIGGRGTGNEQVTEFGDVCSICKPSWGGANYCPTPVWFSFFFVFYHFSVCFSVFTTTPQTVKQGDVWGGGRRKVATRGSERTSRGSSCAWHVYSSGIFTNAASKGRCKDAPFALLAHVLVVPGKIESCVVSCEIADFDRSCEPSFQLHSLWLHAGAMFPQVRGDTPYDVIN